MCNPCDYIRCVMEYLLSQVRDGYTVQAFSFALAGSLFVYAPTLLGRCGCG